MEQYLAFVGGKYLGQSMPPPPGSPGFGGQANGGLGGQPNYGFLVSGTPQQQGGFVGAQQIGGYGGPQPGGFPGQQQGGFGGAQQMQMGGNGGPQPGGFPGQQPGGFPRPPPGGFGGAPQGFGDPSTRRRGIPWIPATGWRLCRLSPSPEATCRLRSVCV